MKVMKRGNLLFLLSAILAYAPAIMAAETTILPKSTYYMGATYFNIVEDGLYGSIEFAVYDRLGGDEFIQAGLESPGEGRFIYAYQVFNQSSTNIGYFSVGHESGKALDAYRESICTRNDLSYGVDCSNKYFTSSMSEGVWKFENGYITGGAHSYFLVFSSDKRWVPGIYRFEPSENDPTPVPDVPEPGTFALLGLGGFLVSRKLGVVKQGGKRA